MANGTFVIIGGVLLGLGFLLKAIGTIGFIIFRNVQPVLSRQWWLLLIYLVSTSIDNLGVFLFLAYPPSEYCLVWLHFLWKIWLPKAVNYFVIIAIKLYFLFKNNENIVMSHDFAEGEVDLAKLEKKKFCTIPWSRLATQRSVAITWGILYGFQLVMMLPGMIAAILKDEVDDICNESVSTALTSVHGGILFVPLIVMVFLLWRTYDAHFLKGELKWIAIMGLLIGIPSYALILVSSTTDYGRILSILFYDTLDIGVLFIPVYLAYKKGGLRRRDHTSTKSSSKSSSMDDDEMDQMLEDGAFLKDFTKFLIAHHDVQEANRCFALRKAILDFKTKYDSEDKNILEARNAAIYYIWMKFLKEDALFQVSCLPQDKVDKITEYVTEQAEKAEDAGVAPLDFYDEILADINNYLKKSAFEPFLKETETTRKLALRTGIANTEQKD